jgi:hypothetical protein
MIGLAPVAAAGWCERTAARRFCRLTLDSRLSFRGRSSAKASGKGASTGNLARIDNDGGTAEGVRRINHVSQASARRIEARPHREAAWVARLDTFARLVEERLSPDADVDVATARKRALSRSLDGRTVVDDMKPRGQRHRTGPSQLELFPPHGVRQTASETISIASFCFGRARRRQYRQAPYRFPVSVADQRSAPYSPHYHQHRARPCRQGHAASCRTRSSDGRSRSRAGLSLAPTSLFAEFVPLG